MLKQLEQKQIRKLETKLNQANRVISELLAALECRDPELRALARDLAVSYMENENENNVKAAEAVPISYSLDGLLHGPSVKGNPILV